VDVEDIDDPIENISDPIQDIDDPIEDAPFPSSVDTTLRFLSFKLYKVRKFCIYLLVERICIWHRPINPVNAS
jgi:hypothetical protein